MPIAMFMEWPGVTREQYDAVCEIVDFEGRHPAGGLFHVAAFDDGGMRVFDLWESAPSFQAFVEQRLMAGVKQAGIEGEPKVTILPAHKVFTPGFKAV